ncbi:NINE protein [Aquabacterium sp.]|uniref:NINE protein n=1 Tax=Aquabacterium sp. TaxID=1872578 RepID=UPI002BA0D6CB|nr:NINE protein [Aquabacterium sp.]HSW02983.1 NINE protein [Aquabacterium sp.]
MRIRSKALATWLALLGGCFGAHRFYLHGKGDLWAWLHPWPTLLGLAGVVRLLNLGQDDPIARLLIPVLGLMISQAMLAAIVIGLTPDERWQARYASARPGGWAAVLGAIAALMIGGAVLMGTVAFSGQMFFEWQAEQQAARP